MALIVNLSSIHTLHPINTSVNAFAELCTRFSSGCISSCPSFFQSWSNYAWVMYQYTMNDKQLIQPYRLGLISTLQFLQNLLALFPFLATLKHDEERLMLLNGGQSYSNNYALALLEDAWNTSIALEETHTLRFPKLVEQAKSEPVYLISNTNELNVRKIIRLLQKQNPTVIFHDPIDLSVQDSKKPIEIAPNIFLCLSYRYQLFKTLTESNSQNPHSTMSLLNHLIKNQLAAEKISVVSQFEGDLREAVNLGIASHNTMTATHYFAEPRLDLKKSA